MSQRYIDNAKKLKLQDTQVEIFKIYAFFHKIEQRASDLAQGAPRVTHLSIRTHSTSSRIFPLKVTAIFLNGSTKGAV